MFATYRAMVVLSAVAVLSALGNPAAGGCPGNCNDDPAVQINELIACVGMALDTIPIGSCPSCDVDLSGAVEINELILAVGFALDPDVVIDLICMRPGANGLEGCATGTPLSAFRCDDRADCLSQQAARTGLNVVSETSDGAGRFELTVADCGIFDSPLILAATVDSAEFRVVDIGPAALDAGPIATVNGVGRRLGVIISPVSEAAVRLLDASGLDRFSDGAVQDVIVAVAEANADTDFTGRDPEAAVEIATTTAQGDPLVLDLLEPTAASPTPTRTPAPPGDTLRSGIPVVATLMPVGDTHQYSFTLDAPTRVLVQITNAQPEYLINPCVEVRPGRFDPPVENGVACGGFAASLDLMLQPGTYFAVVADAGNDNQGAYDLLLQRVRLAEASPLGFDTERTESIDQFSDIDLYSFALESESRVRLNMRNTVNFDINTCVAIVDAAGAPIAGACDGFASRLDVLLPAGSYVAVVNEGGIDNRGAYALFLQRLSVADAVPLLPDSSENIAPIGEVDLYSFTLVDQSRIVLQAGHPSFAINVCIFILPTVNDSAVDGGSVCGGSSARIDQLVLAAGTYFVLILDDGHDNTGPYDLLFRVL